jgi:hypothetical protein
MSKDVEEPEESRKIITPEVERLSEKVGEQIKAFIANPLAPQFAFLRAEVARKERLRRQMNPSSGEQSGVSSRDGETIQ